jgi:transcriptional regulator with XRE-family HTH domain
MTEPTFSEYFESKYSSEPERRRYAQNSLIVDTAIAIDKALESSGIKQKDLATRLGRSEGYVSQVLSGGANLTLRTLADFAYALDRMVDVALKPLGASSAVFTTNIHASWKFEAAPEAPASAPEAPAANTKLGLAA